MTLLAFASVIFMNFSSTFAISQTVSRIPTRNDAVYKQLLKMDFTKYINRKAALFFENIGFNYTEYVPITKKPGYIDRVMFVFNDSVTVDVRVKDLGQKEPLNFNYKLNIKLSKVRK